MSRMDILSDQEINDLITKSSLAKKYNEYFDRESAYEILTAKLEALKQEEQKVKETKTSTTKTQQGNSDVTKGIIKVVTSATFIRAAFGILNKILSGGNSKGKRK